jgi:hypothetical protein
VNYRVFHASVALKKFTTINVPQRVATLFGKLQLFSDVNWRYISTDLLRPCDHFRAFLSAFMSFFPFLPCLPFHQQHQTDRVDRFHRFNEFPSQRN